MRDDRLPFDLSALQVFASVCDTGTMAAAAATLRMTQPAVSQVIQDLESRLGTRLFDRNLRPIALLPAGILLRQHAIELLDLARLVGPAVRGVERGNLALLRIGIVESLTRVLSLPVTNAVADAAARVVLLSGLAVQHASALLNRQLDLVIGIDDLAESSGVERCLAATEPYVIIAKREAGPLELAALATSQPLIRFSGRSRTGAEVDQYLRRCGIEAPRTLEFDSCYGVSSAVASGLGWAISTPLCLIEAGLPAEAYSIALPPQRPLRRAVSVTSRSREMGPIPRTVAAITAQAVRDNVAAFFAATHPWIVDTVDHSGLVRYSPSGSSTQMALEDSRAPRR